ncbi:hypothetical protein [Mycobacterium intracellulare]|uniref:hypothetical protein n=1 Tax=Mycobacterium intracellulare TaxID=1767 RepID=UPI001F60A179|nr:hypothetical protein [Mycobacterium intracellulare]
MSQVGLEALTEAGWRHGHTTTARYAWYPWRDGSAAAVHVHTARRCWRCAGHRATAGPPPGAYDALRRRLRARALNAAVASTSSGAMFGAPE